MRKKYTTRESSEQFQSSMNNYTQKAREQEFSRSRALAALNKLKKPQEVEVNAEQEEQKAEQQIVNEDELDRTLPPRRVLFPSNYAKLTKIFYHVLVFLFFCLLIALLLWGRHIMTEGF